MFCYSATFQRERKVSHKKAGSQRARRGGESPRPHCTFIRGRVVKDHLAKDE